MTPLFKYIDSLTHKGTQNTSKLCQVKSNRPSIYKKGMEICITKSTITLLTLKTSLKNTKDDIGFNPNISSLG